MINVQNYAIQNIGLLFVQNKTEKKNKKKTKKKKKLHIFDPHEYWRYTAKGYTYVKLRPTYSYNPIEYK